MESKPPSNVGALAHSHGHMGFTPLKGRLISDLADGYGETHAISMRLKLMNDAIQFGPRMWPSSQYVVPKDVRRKLVVDGYRAWGDNVGDNGGLPRIGRWCQSKCNYLGRV